MIKKLLIVIFIGLTITCGTNRCAKKEIYSPTIVTLCKNFSVYQDVEIVLQGKFLGWGGTNCHFPENASSAITRSDWIFSDTTGCIYVTGGRIGELDPFEKKNVGTPISIRVIPRLGTDQKIYLEFCSGTVFVTPQK